MSRLARARCARAVVLAAIASAACGRELPPAGQIVLYVDTDAVVRAPAGAPVDLGALSPMVDRARFEVLQGGKPLPNNTRDVPLDAGMLSQRRLSFGIVPPPNETDVTVRVRLFRADRVFGTDPDPGIALDTTVALPPVASEGVVELSVLLKTDDFGLAIGPVAPAHGPPVTSAVGTWRGGRRVPCGADAAAGEACVPGASYFYGNPQFRGRVPTNDIFAERLVFVSPFYLDVTEVTVSAFRERWPTLSGKVPEPLAQAPGDNAFCTWTSAPGAGESRPVNCVSWTTAEAYCELLGKRLPTEAEFELVTSGTGEEWAFPWGNDEPGCGETVWGLGGIATATDDAIARGADDCRSVRGEAGPLPPGHGSSDTLSAAVVHSAKGEPIEDLGGNLAEWMKDVWARPTDPFWASVRPIVDPVSVVAGADGPNIRPVRGGDWASTELTTRAGFRRQRSESSGAPLVGFRCARPATTR